MLKLARNARFFLFLPLILVLFFAAACAAAEPQVIEKEVIKEVEKIVEVEVEKEVQKIVEVINETVKEVVVVATPVPGVFKTELPNWVSIGADHHYNGALTFVHRANPGFLDVHYGASSTTTLLPSGPRFNQILMYDPQASSEITGDLAHSWEVSDDGMEFIFHLNHANWHDGEPVTADDIIFSLDRMVEEGVTRGRVTAARDFYAYGTGEAIDEHTVRMPLSAPSSTALGWLAVDYYKMYPKHVVENRTQDELNCCYENNVGSGAWIFSDWKKGDSWEFDRNDNYFKDPMPFFDTMKVFVIEDAARRLASLTTQQVMGWLVMGGTTLEDMMLVQKDSGGAMRAYASGPGSMRGFWMHLNKPPFDDPRVRRAVYLTVDREAIRQVSYSGEGFPGNYFPPGYAHTPEEILQFPGWRHPKDEDIARAKELMAEAGYPDGMQLNFNVDQAKASRTEAEMVAAQLKVALNIDVELQVHDRASMYQGMRDGSHNFSNVGSGLFFKEPSAVIAQFFTPDVLRNPENWSNPRVDELISAQAIEMDPEARVAQYREMEEILSGEHPDYPELTAHYVQLFWLGRAGMLDHRIQNFLPPYHPHCGWTYEHVWWDENAQNPGPDALPVSG